MSKATPAEPSSLTTRPQYGSSPLSEHLTRADSATLRAARWASSSVAAPVTTTCATLVAPSASATIMPGQLTAGLGQGVGQRGDGHRRRRLAPLARTSTVSLVDVHPSTVIRLKLALDGATQRRGQDVGLAPGVGGEHGQHGRHVGGEHGRPLGHAPHREPRALRP